MYKKPLESVDYYLAQIVIALVASGFYNFDGAVKRAKEMLHIAK